ncbi:hypothetical protein AC579_8034 [Pseudocercospora musae]|uniref:BTB domain-containing protein n=1 Tax=Pseudocercospora musae TaxID=113226 RepID=A0A139IPI0_9PEZI|nr:hypothetical protein AC579_8034 [Pseudocercospora musae]
MASTSHSLALADLKGFHTTNSSPMSPFAFRAAKFARTRLCFASRQTTSKMTFSGRFVVTLGIWTRMKHRLIRACKESWSNEIELKEDDPDVLAGMLRYIYGLDPFEAVTFSTLRATPSAKRKMEEKWNTPSFPGYVYSIHQQTAAHGGELRQIANDICRKHLPELMAKKEFKEVFLNTPELALAIMQVVAREDVTQRSR